MVPQQKLVPGFQIVGMARNLGREHGNKMHGIRPTHFSPLFSKFMLSQLSRSLEQLTQLRNSHCKDIYSERKMMPFSKRC